MTTTISLFNDHPLLTLASGTTIHIEPTAEGMELLVHMLRLEAARAAGRPTRVMQLDDAPATLARLGQPAVRHFARSGRELVAVELEDI